MLGLEQFSLGHERGSSHDGRGSFVFRIQSGVREAGQGSYAAWAASKAMPPSRSFSRPAVSTSVRRRRDPISGYADAMRARRLLRRARRRRDSAALAGFGESTMCTGSFSPTAESSRPIGHRRAPTAGALRRYAARELARTNQCTRAKRSALEPAARATEPQVWFARRRGRRACWLTSTCAFRWK